jgi:GNAT superfamily N-acetyltransferase
LSQRHTIAIPIAVTDTSQNYRLRIATPGDCDAIRALMDLAIHQLQQGYLTPDQVAASAVSMGLDTQLIDDGTYFTVWSGGTLAGCGGWSRRATLYGGNHSAGRDISLLDPARDRARIRAMYTHPDHVGNGIGRMVIEAGEAAARAEGFGALEMAATMAGKPFYLKCGYVIEREWFDENGAVPVPLATMVKSLAD